MDYLQFISEYFYLSYLIFHQLTLLKESGNSLGCVYTLGCIYTGNAWDGVGDGREVQKGRDVYIPMAGSC